MAYGSKLVFSLSIYMPAVHTCTVDMYPKDNRTAPTGVPSIYQVWHCEGPDMLQESEL